jgi:catechol 2,3-dioxygenase-like lactoylglutathione lyase family enzyme
MNDATHPSPRATSAAWTFDHVNVSMGTRHALGALFEGVMGLRPGFRPPFPFPGLWLYAGDQALVHAVDDVRLSAQTDELNLGHIAFRSEQPASGVIERLQGSGLPFKVAHLPQDRIAQIFVRLPGGLVIELDVPDDTAAPAGHAYSATQAAPGAHDF